MTLTPAEPRQTAKFLSREEATVPADSSLVDGDQTPSEDRAEEEDDRGEDSTQNKDNIKRFNQQRSLLSQY
jgi:hypothetical protein